MAIQLPEKPWSEGDSFIVEDTGLEYTFNGEVWVSPRGTVEFPAPVYMGDEEPRTPRRVTSGTTPTAWRCSSTTTMERTVMGHDHGPWCSCSGR